MFCFINSKFDFPILLILVYGSNLAVSNSRSVDPELENEEFQTMYSNPKLCSSTTVSYTTKTLLYTWQIRNIFSYQSFVENYSENFTHQIDNIKFSSNDGVWAFRLRANKNLETDITQAFVSVIYEQEKSLFQGNNAVIGIKAQISNDALGTNDIYEQKVFQFPIRMLTQNNTRIEAQPEIQSVSAPKANSIDSTPATIIIKTESSDRRSRAKRSPWFISALNPEDSDHFFHFNRNEASKRYNRSIQVLVYESADIQNLLNTFIENAGQRFKTESIYLKFLIMLASPNDPMKVEKLHCPVYGAKSPMKLESSSNIIFSKTESPFTPSKHKLSVNPKGPPFLNNMENILGSSLYSDLILNHQGHQIHAHRIVLASSSEKLFELIKNASSYMQEGITKLDLLNLKISKSSMFEILRFIYTGEVNDWSSYATEISIGANYFKISSLKSLAVEFLLKQISLENSIELYSLSKDISAPKLTKATLSFIKKNRKRLIGQTDDFQILASKHPTLMFELFIS